MSAYERTTATRKTSKGFTDEELAVMLKGRLQSRRS